MHFISLHSELNLIGLGTLPYDKGESEGYFWGKLSEAFKNNFANTSLQILGTFIKLIYEHKDTKQNSNGLGLLSQNQRN